MDDTSSSTTRWNGVPRGTMDKVSSRVRLDLPTASDRILPVTRRACRQVSHHAESYRHIRRRAGTVLECLLRRISAPRSYRRRCLPVAGSSAQRDRSGAHQSQGHHSRETENAQSIQNRGYAGPREMVVPEFSRLLNLPTACALARRLGPIIAVDRCVHFGELDRKMGQCPSVTPCRALYCAGVYLRSTKIW